MSLHFTSLEQTHSYLCTCLTCQEKGEKSYFRPATGRHQCVRGHADHFKGELMRYSDVGSYSLAYFCKPSADSKLVEGELCADCALAYLKANEGSVVAAEPNLENPLLYCEDCNKRIPSTYAEELAPESADQ